MDTISRLYAAERLNCLTPCVGFALWQLQELEHAAAEYFVLLAQAKQGMGIEAGEVLVAKATGNTFGQTITKLRAANLLSGDLEMRFLGLLRERNWLVHASRRDSRAAIHMDSKFESLTIRLNGIAEEALQLLREIGVLAEQFVKAHGVSKQQIDRMANELLAKWRRGDAI